MSVPAAYIGVILIWSTTPLAIKWSSDAGFLFGVSARMLLGTLVALAIMGALSIPLPRHRMALQAYVAAGLGIFIAMTSVYWSAQFIPSGLISVIFGLSPIMTGVIAGVLLSERAFTFGKLLGMLLGVLGLLVIFEVDHASLGENAWMGLLGVLFSAFIQALSAVFVKRINADVHPLAQTGGGLLFAAPFFLGAWLLFGEGLSIDIPLHAGASILYLAIVGSVFGFMMYYYVIKHLDATRVALITLVTPVLALVLGNLFNAEPITDEVIYGTGMILLGLVSFQFADKLFRGRQLVYQDEDMG